LTARVHGYILHFTNIEKTDILFSYIYTAVILDGTGTLVYIYYIT
jgi:hypothetical protein